jgi:hypothetical protein
VKKGGTMTDDAAGRAAGSDDLHQERLEALVEKLPGEWMRNAVHWLLSPNGRLVRIPVGILLMLGGVFSILPVLGVWMLPLGIILLAEDFPPLRWLVDRIMDWIDRRWPQVFERKESEESR